MCIRDRVYGGQPEAMVVLVLTLAIFLVIVILLRARSTTSDRPIIRPIGDLAVATIAGGALAAPLALPGLQLAGLSVRQTASGINSLAAHEIAYVIFQGYDGLPIAGSYPFGGTYFYNQTAAYVGVIAVVLAVVAVGVRWRRPEVVALAVATLTTVSYTHLDVYKRQPLHCSVPSCCGASGSSSAERPCWDGPKRPPTAY